MEVTSIVSVQVFKMPQQNPAIITVNSNSVLSPQGQNANCDGKGVGAILESNSAIAIPIDMSLNQNEPNLESNCARKTMEKNVDNSKNHETSDSMADKSFIETEKEISTKIFDSTNSIYSSVCSSIVSTEIKAESDLSEDKPSCLKKYRGLLLGIISSFMFALSALVVKKLESFDPFNAAFYKFQGALIPGILLLLQKYFCSKKGKQVVSSVWPLNEKEKLKEFAFVLLRTILACNALLLHYFSLKYLHMADTLTITSTYPIFVAILASVILKEKCGLFTIVASVCSLAGVVAIAKPPFLFGTEDYGNNAMIGTAFALGCTLLKASSMICLRYSRNVHYSVTFLAYGAWGSFETLITVLLIPGLLIPKNSTEWGLVFANALLTVLGQIALILALKSEQAGPVSLTRTLDVLFGFMFGMAFLGQTPDMWSLIGATVIIVSVMCVGLRKWIKGLPNGHPLKAKFGF